MTTRICGILLAVLAARLLFAIGCARSQTPLPTVAPAVVPYSVQGTLTYEVTGWPVLCRHFTASVSNGCWHISVKLEGKTGILSSEYRYDGTNNLQYALFEKSGPDEGSGLIETGAVPSATSTDAGEVVWLGYASGGYFRRLKARAATSLEPLRGHGHTKRREVPAEWKGGVVEPLLPVEVSYYATNVAVLDEDGNVFSVPLEKPGALKHLAAHLRSWDAVSFQRMSIPRRFEWTTYWARAGKRGIGCIVRGRATNVCSLVPFPALPSTLHLQDNRSEESFVRKVTDGKIPALDVAP